MKSILDNLNSLLPTYNVTLPFSNIEVDFTPFKVKDAKNISIILQEDNKQLALKALFDLLKNCCKNFDPSELCLADAEYLFLMIRSKSVEEQLNLIVNSKPIQVNIFDIKNKNTIVNEELKITPDLILKIETPKLKDLLNIKNLSKKDILQASIKKIIANKEVYTVEKYLTSELEEFLNNLPLSVLSSLEQIKHPELYINVLTQDGDREVSGTLTFFTFR